MFVDYLSVLLYMNVDIAQLDFASVSLYKLINYDSNISIVTTYYICMIIYVFVGFVHMGAWSLFHWSLWLVVHALCICCLFRLVPANLSETWPRWYSTHYSTSTLAVWLVVSVIALRLSEYVRMWVPFCNKFWSCFCMFLSQLLFLPCIAMVATCCNMLQHVFSLCVLLFAAFHGFVAVFTGFPDPKWDELPPTESQADLN